MLLMTMVPAHFMYDVYHDTRSHCQYYCMLCVTDVQTL